MTIFRIGILLNWIGCVFACSSVLAAPPRLSAADAESLNRSAQLDNVSPSEALRSYLSLLSVDRSERLKGVEYLRLNDASEVAAFLLPRTHDREVQWILIQIAVRKSSFGWAVCNALLDELQELNSLAPDTDESRAGVEEMKRYISTPVARWLGMPDPAIPFDPGKSKSAYAAFAGQARRKAIAVGSP